MTSPTTGYSDIDEIIVGLHDLAVWRQAHPEIITSMAAPGLLSVFDHLTDKTPAEIVRAIMDGAPVGSITKSIGGDDDGLMFVKRNFGAHVRISYHTARDEVCERVVVGTETVEIPGPDAPLVSVEREIVEWKCEPMLAGAKS